MSYQVLARKWRPQTFSELVGQQHVVDAITNALDNNKLHHAYLFTGTRGVGKTTIARIFSKSLNCEEGQSANPCGKCDTCLDISEGRFVDLLEIDAASRTKVEDTRELLDNVQYKPTRGKYKVYLIDEVHMLSKHSFNALLKTLEEPPPHVKFLLATTDPQKLPVTILSRCLQFSLKSLSREQIQTQLATILAAEKLTYEMPALSQIARAAAGSMRDALSLTDQAIAQGNNLVTLDTVVSMLGLLDKNQVLRLAKCIGERDADNAMKQLDEICADSPDYSQVLSQLLALLHQVALTQIVPDICKLDTNVAKPIYTLAKSLSPEHVQLLYQIGLNGKRDLPFAPDAFTGLQMTIMRMIAFTPAQSLPLELSASVKQDTSAYAHANEQANIEPQNRLITNESTQDKSVLRENMSEASKRGSTEGELSNAEAIPTSSESPENFSHMHSSATPDFPAASDEHDDSHYDADPRSYQEDEPINTAPVLQQETQEDAVSQLQDLFDMEQDIASYEREAAGDNDGKKPELTKDEAPTAPSSENVSESFTRDDQVAVTSKTDSDEPASAGEITIPNAVSTISDNDFADDINAESVDASDDDIVEVNAENVDSYEVNQTIASEQTNSEEESIDKHQAEAPSSITNITAKHGLTAYLDNGEKLMWAAQIDKWSAFIDSLSAKGLSRQLLIHGRSPGIKDNCLLLEISQSHHHLNEQSTVNNVKEALKEKYQRDIDIKVEYAEVVNTPYQLQQQINEMRLFHAKQVVRSDSAIQELIKAFDATVIPDSIQSR